MNNKWQKVLEFHKSFGAPVRTVPTLLGPKDVNKRYNFLIEECEEFKEATTLDKQVDAMIDLIYFALGTLVEMGVKPNNIFDIVHEANMSKKWQDGQPRFNEVGKILKPSNWIDPQNRIIAELENQRKGL